MKKRRSVKYTRATHSPYWYALKRLIKLRRGNRCEICGRRGPTPFQRSDEEKLDLHHLHYDTLGKEQPEDVQLVCRSCHNKLHKRRKK